MKGRKRLFTSVITGALLVATAVVAQDTPDGFWFWRWGHMDGPHDSSKALGISRDGKVAVGSTLVVDFWRAWRSDIDWAIATDDGVPPLYNELQVQEDLGVIAPSQPSAAWGASDMAYVPNYDLLLGNIDWGGSFPVGGAKIGNVPYAVEWLPAFVPNEDGVLVPTYLGMPDFGGGLTDITAYGTSVDGVKIVGTGNNRRGVVAFVADKNLVDAELVPIKFPLTIQDSVTLMTLKTSSARAVSADGNTIAGFGAASTGNRAFVSTVDWSIASATTPPTLVSTVLPMIGGGSFAEAYAMTPDGMYIAGRSGSPKGPQACVWTKDPSTLVWKCFPVGGLSKKKLDSVAYGVAVRPAAVDGELLVIGRSQSILYPSEAFVFAGTPDFAATTPAFVPEVGFLYDLEYILTKTTVFELSAAGSEWILNEATGISADGTRIVGWGTNPEGGIEAWVVTGFPTADIETLFIKEE
jgi:uncharacterized membrane protein